MDAFVLPVVLVVILVLSVFVFRPSYMIVPEEERLVIYRLGRFERVAGPGMVWFLRGLDRVQRRFSVRSVPQDCSVDGLFVYGIPVGLTLNLWCRYDPVKAADGNKARLTELTLFTQAERSSQLELKLRDSLIRQISRIEQTNLLSPSATIADKILPILPGVPTCAEILMRVRQDLVQSLPSLGIFLDMNRPIMLSRVQLPAWITTTFERNGIISEMRRVLPSLSDRSVAILSEMYLMDQNPTASINDQPPTAQPAGAQSDSPTRYPDLVHRLELQRKLGISEPVSGLEGVARLVVRSGKYSFPLKPGGRLPLHLRLLADAEVLEVDLRLQHIEFVFEIPPRASGPTYRCVVSLLLRVLDPVRIAFELRHPLKILEFDLSRIVRRTSRLLEITTEKLGESEFQLVTELQEKFTRWREALAIEGIDARLIPQDRVLGRDSASQPERDSLLRWLQVIERASNDSNAMHLGISEDGSDRPFPPNVSRDEQRSGRISTTQERVYARLRIDGEISELTETGLEQLIESIANHTQTPVEDISVSYILPGSVLVTLEMPEASAPRLLAMYLEKHPAIANLGISEVRVAPKPPALGEATPRLLASPRWNPDINYELGLERLRELTALRPESIRGDFLTLEHRLVSLLKDIRLFGANQDTRSQLSEVVHSLNLLMDRIQPGSSFNDLCIQRVEEV